MFRIGEFSRIAQVSGRLLRYYDEIGLLSPDFTDPETGYRYYSAHQLPRLNRILVLKELGLSLEQVARLLDQQTSTEEIRGMLTLRKAQIERTVQEEMARFRDIESRLQQSDGLHVPDVVLKTVPAQGLSLPPRHTTGYGRSTTARREHRCRRPASRRKEHLEHDCYCDPFTHV